MNGSWGAYLTSPADFAGVDDIHPGPVTLLRWWSLCVSVTPRAMPVETQSLAGATVPDWSRDRDLTKDSPWPSRLGVGR